MIYFILYPPRKAVKIGHGGNPATRLKSFQTGCPDPLQLITMIPGGLKEEQEWHASFERYRMRGEWFHYVGALQDAIDRVFLTNNFSAIVKTEPRIGELIQHALSYHDYQGNFCRDMVWYGMRDFPSIKWRLNSLVGFAADRDDYLIRSVAAYDFAYRAVMGSLPECTPGCGCFGDEDENEDGRDWLYTGENKPAWADDVPRGMSSFTLHEAIASAAATPQGQRILRDKREGRLGFR